VSKTPILDCEEPVPQIQSRRWWLYGLLGAIVAAVLLGLVLGLYHKPWPTIHASLLKQLLIYELVFFISVLVHELGHLVAGLAVGLEFSSLNVGIFLLDKQAHGYRLRLIPWRINSSGFCSMSPRSTNNLAGCYLRFSLGGPVASLLLLLVTLALPWGLLVGFMFFVNLFTSLLSFIPIDTGGRHSDAKRVLVLARGGVAAEQVVAMLYFVALDSRGVEPRDWPRELLDKICVPIQDQSMRTAGLAFRYCSAVDSGDPELMAEILEEALARSDRMRPSGLRAFFVGASFFQEVYRGNAPLARKWLRRAGNVKGVEAGKNWDSQALAAVPVAEGKYVLAREHLARCIAELDRSAASGTNAAERKRMVALMNQVAVSDP
jgi:hypothetical protein